MEQETQIYFLRHGQTDNNREGRMQGRVDIPLNETGRAQARCVARRLKSISFDAVYSSPLGRAVETAQIVTGLPTQEINIEPRAIELGFGVWDNRLHAELEKETEQFDILWDETDKYVPPQGAEPLEDLMTRVHAMLQELAARHAGGRILVTTHGGVQQAESPEWMPAISMCSKMPPTNTSLPSQSASTSTSMAASRKRSR